MGRAEQAGVPREPSSLDCWHIAFMGTVSGKRTLFGRWENKECTAPAESERMRLQRTGDQSGSSSTAWFVHSVEPASVPARDSVIQQLLPSACRVLSCRSRPVRVCERR